LQSRLNTDNAIDVQIVRRRTGTEVLFNSFSA